ncbi:hypothetical protein [Veillonella sp. oral taxon 780]|uniref:methylmalonyl-CoA decarboxylase subunit epsilon n=1 Tax=Veillonella sp. oral taxon 780 TaxID=671229 RepID=UPI0005716FBD|nr:hypothetical protein [Veillonella sp. oral taxon 780]
MANYGHQYDNCIRRSNFIRRAYAYYLSSRSYKKKSTKAEVAEVSSATAPSAVTTTNHDEVVAAIVAAVCAMGYSKSQIASVRPIVSTGWKLDGRLLGRNVTR